MRSDDEKLVSQTLAGDRDAFGVLVHKYQEMVYAYAFQKVRNEEDAQDVTQEVFWRAYRHLYQLRQPHRFRSWLYTIMSNECKRRLVSIIKTRQRETALEDATDDALRIEPAYATPTEGWRVDLEQALSELPDDNRVAVSMFYMGDNSLKEISEFLGISVNTVKGKLYRARQQLGSALSERYGRLLESYKLKGGFLMQFMEQIHHIPSPTMASSWSNTAIGKILFSLIMAVCVLIGIARYGTDSSMSLSMNRIGIEETTKVILLTPIADVTRTSIPVASVEAENRSLTASSRASGDQGRQLAVRRAAPGSGGSTQLPVAATESSSEKLIFSGHVVDNNGNPVADAEIGYVVIFYPFKGKIESGYSSYFNHDFFTRTGLDGTFQFELVEWMPFDSKGMLKRLNITVAHPDYAIWWQEVPFQSTTDMGIQLEMPEIVSGKVMNEVGEPIQGAEVQIQSVSHGDPIRGDPRNSLTHDALPQPVKTDASGEFVLPRLPQGATMTLDVKGPGYAKENRHNVPVSAKRLEFRLKREGKIKGRLTYADTGKPITHARVSSGWGATLVDKNGNYLLANLAPGTYSVYLANGPKGWTAIPKESITISEGQTVSNVDLTLIRSGFITGRVTNRDTNEPIINYPIRLKDAARPEGSHLLDHYALTDKTGAYHFDAAPGRVLVYTNLPVGYQDDGQIERLDTEQIRRNVDVVEGETVVVDFQY
ncbi:sigma-70 family RNA polymerase sigma factor [Candidatus Poribacteria bacterium]|nr:sigma-70 family RNA polymerase sigma factor [Candidatus Poribacteria bacterium]